MSEPLPLPHFRQSAPGYCLPACVRMVLAYLGLERSEVKVSRMLGARGFGTSSFAVRRLTLEGLRVIYGEWSVSRLVAALDAGRPVILFVRTGFLDYWQRDVAHAVVAVGFEEGAQYWLHDPVLPDGPRIVSWNGLLAAWAEFGYRAATISRGT
jgi:ABC-type bacteriocin/lantibiotic exporter with double-glycine peptidase domain